MDICQEKFMMPMCFPIQNYIKREHKALYFLIGKGGVQVIIVNLFGRYYAMVFVGTIGNSW